MSLGLLPRIRSFRFHYGLDMIIAAYRASADGPEKDKKRAERASREWKHAGEHDEHPDPQGYSDYLHEIHEEAEVALKLIREAFVISLFHFWERQAKAWTEAGSHYVHDKVIDALRRQGLSPERDMLHLLLLVANVAKHSAGSSAEKLFEVRPDLFRFRRPYGSPYIGPAEGECEPEYKPGYEDLLVPEPLLESFFAAVRGSGPPKTPLRF